jgi:hypothetical protein
MKMSKLFLGIILLFLSTHLWASDFSDSLSTKKEQRYPFPYSSLMGKRIFQDTLNPNSLLNKVSVGGLLHAVGVGFKDNPSIGNGEGWSRQLNIYRCRILLGVQLTKKTSFFMETDIPNIIGRTNRGNGNTGGSKDMQVSPVILDAQIQHDFTKNFGLIAGLQLVGITRNQMQGAASLMALDFGYYQYPYNLFENSPLQGNFGRDVGINLRGFAANERLELRGGVFTGRNMYDSPDDDESPLRFIGRVNYNFLDKEKDLYYTGTTLGKGNIFAIGGGADIQGKYRSFGIDAFLDKPLGDAGSITLNAAFTHSDGGNFGEENANPNIVKQNIHFLELGYYFKSAKIQPYLKYEKIDAKSDKNQIGLPISEDAWNDFKSAQRVGGGINYFFQGFNSNVKLSYESVKGGFFTGTDVETKTWGEVWLQWQFFIF